MVLADLNLLVPVLEPLGIELAVRVDGELPETTTAHDHSIERDGEEVPAWIEAE